MIMKKNIFKLFSAMVVSATVLTGCIEEVFPEDSTATSDQIGASATAIEASLNGLPSQMVQGYLVYGKQTHETDLAYPSLMLAQTELLGDVVATDYGYDWWWRFNANNGMNDTGYYSYLPYFTLYKFVKSANDVIAAVDVTDPTITDEMRGLGSIAHAFRALDYYTLMVLFEPVENIYTDCSKVLGLTVPIVTEATTNDIAKSNPRATHEELVNFILADLDKAEIGLESYTPVSKNFPDLAVVYGLKAKVYMWDGQFAKAAEYARKAIDKSGATPMSESQWHNPTTGFNTATSAWMWYLHPTASNMGNLANFIGHISNEADWGYASLSKLQMARSLYDAIPATDFRKYSYLDPDRSTYAYQSVRGNAWLDEQPDYMSLKFRPVGGDYNNYNFSTGDLRNFQLEVLKQMRIEFWGEGIAFPTAKRLKPDVIQNYEGTNFIEDIFKINCKGVKPNWTLMIPKTEVDSNTALQGMNNPDPSGAIAKRPTPIGEFAPGNN